MSYTLTPIIIDFTQVRSLMGSKDTAFLQAFIKKHRKALLGLDEGDEFFEDFEHKIQAEYKALAAGDFSSVDLNQTYPEREEDEEDEGQLAAFREDVGKVDPNDPAAMKQFLEKHGGLLEDFFGDDDDEDEEENEEDEDDEPARELTAGAALVQMILGGTMDPAQGSKYGYTLNLLCESLGTVPDHDAWCSIRSAAFDTVDAILKKIGIDPKSFATHTFLVSRGAPVLIPKADDFPFIGYLERKEIPAILGRLDSAKVEAEIKGEDKYEQEWIHEAIGELRGWLEACAKDDRDLICFYA
jgi:hypothetical protein